MRIVELAAQCGEFRAPDQTAFDRGNALGRACLPRAQGERLTERSQRPAATFAVQATRERSLALGIAVPGAFTAVDALQVRHRFGLLWPQLAQDRGAALGGAQGLQILVARGQRGIALSDQRLARIAHTFCAG